MKTLISACTGAVFSVALSGTSYAIDTTRTYSSGILVAVFLAFCALVVVIQLIPAIMMLISFIKALGKGESRRQTSKGQARL